MANYQNLKPPIKGEVIKVFSNVTKLRNNSKTWEVHRSTNHEIMLDSQADNMTIGNLNVMAILELAAATLMTLRMKDISGKDEDFYPLNDRNWPSSDEMFEIDETAELYTIIDDNDITTVIEKIKKSIKYEYVDDGMAKPRNGRFHDSYDDDEDLARKVSNYFYKEVAGKPKKENRAFYRAIGALFAENLAMLKRNGLYFNIYLMSRSQAETFNNDMSDERKEEIIRRQTNPNHRNSYLTAIGFEECKSDAKMVDKMRDNILKKQAIHNKNYYKVRYLL